MSDNVQSFNIAEVDAGPSNCPKRVRYPVIRPMDIEPEGESYRMNRKIRKAFIFNHYTFDVRMNLADRPGTEHDVARLKEILPLFHFTFEVYQDLRKLEILTKIQEIYSGNYDDCDCLAIFVLSHGKEHSIAARDEFYFSSELWTPFSGISCPTMAGKPKLFFINACRGDRLDDETIEFKKDYTTDGANENQIEEQTNESEYHLVYNIPNMADILIAYSTYDGFVSHRRPLMGSWFIQAFCDALTDEKLKHMEIKQLLTRVTNKVALEMCPVKRTKQVPVVVSSLIRDLYLCDN